MTKEKPLDWPFGGVWTSIRFLDIEANVFRRLVLNKSGCVISMKEGWKKPYRLFLELTM